MSKAKDKRIKKLKRHRIWPSIFGLFLIVLVFFVCMLIVLASSAVEVVDDKLTTSYDTSGQIVKRYVEPNIENLDHSYEGIMTDIVLNEGIDAVSIGRNGKKVWSSDGRYPDQNARISYMELFHEGRGYTDYDIIIEEDPQNVIVKDGDTYAVSKDFLKKNNLKNVIVQLVKDDDGIYQPLASLKLWYVFPVDGLEVYVLNHIVVYSYDIVYLMLVFVLFAMLLAIFIIYYICTVLSMIASQSKVTKVLYTDLVTGGENWLSFIRKSERYLKRNRNNKRKYAIVHLRMEKYRSFCTCFGVKEGEELLERFYRILKKQIRSKEVMAHYEQADFALLLQYEDELDITSRIETIKQALNGITPNIKLYFSVGICMVEKGAKDVEEMYNSAMSATAMLLEDAEPRIAFFDIEMKKQQLWEHKVEDEMERALKNKEFKVYLQPKYSAREEKIAGAEALVRWVHPSEGLIPPNRFIPIFERNGFILQLDDYMLEEVAKQQAKWMKDGQSLVPVSVNVSRAHFTREDLAEHICAIIDKYQVPHHVIELELTESAFFDDKQVLLNTVNQLREQGFVVSMDDFGAGYSSLNSLKELHIDVLKIDADFFRGAGSVERGMLIVSEVIDLAKKLQMKIVAEGIENREQVDFLAQQECDLIQGYYFAKPMPIEEFEEKYKETTS
ncbi:MAG: EAL domain-containing protein [Lachnospiraceae bacterium]|nr:EAL domain-containing protein [Lachnospiraceae bacterium]